MEFARRGQLSPAMTAFPPAHSAIQEAVTSGSPPLLSLRDSYSTTITIEPSPLFTHSPSIFLFITIRSLVRDTGHQGQAASPEKKNLVVLLYNIYTYIYPHIHIYIISKSRNINFE